MHGWPARSSCFSCVFVCAYFVSRVRWLFKSLVPVCGISCWAAHSGSLYCAPLSCISSTYIPTRPVEAPCAQVSSPAPVILSMVNGLRKGSSNSSGFGRSDPSPRASCGASAHDYLAHLREGGAATPLAPYSPRRSSRTYAIYPLSLAGLSSEAFTTVPRQPRLYPRSRAPDSRNSLLSAGGPLPQHSLGGLQGFSPELVR